MKILSTGTLSFQLLYPFIVPIGTLIRAIAFTIDGEVYDKFLFISLFIFIADTIGGVFYLCIHVSQNEDQKLGEESTLEQIVVNLSEDNTSPERTQSSGSQSGLHKDNIVVQKDYKTLKIFLLFSIPALFHFLSFNILSLVCASQGQYLNGLQAELKNGRIIFTSLICLVAFRFQYYKHHIIAIVLIIIGLIVNIVALSYYNKDVRDNFAVKHFLLFFLTYLLDGGKVVIEKKLLDKFKLIPLQAIFIEGICGIVINVVFALFAMIIPCNESLGVCTGNSLFDFNALGTALTETKFYLFLLLILISSIIDDVFSMLTVYYFLPTHQNVADAISSCLLWITINLFYPANLQQNLPFLNSFFPFPGYVVSILGSLMYNEIIVFYFCGLAENTKKEIIDRAEFESKEIKQENLLIRKNKYNKV